MPKSTTDDPMEFKNLVEFVVPYNDIEPKECDSETLDNTYGKDGTFEGYKLFVTDDELTPEIVAHILGYCKGSRALFAEVPEQYATDLEEAVMHINTLKDLHASLIRALKNKREPTIASIDKITTEASLKEICLLYTSDAADE